MAPGRRGRWAGSDTRRSSRPLVCISRDHMIPAPAAASDDLAPLSSIPGDGPTGSPGPGWTIAPPLQPSPLSREAGKRGLTERFRGPRGEIVASSNRVTSNHVAKDVTMPKRDRAEYMRQYRARMQEAPDIEDRPKPRPSAPQIVPASVPCRCGRQREELLFFHCLRCRKKMREYAARRYGRWKAMRDEALADGPH